MHKRETIEDDLSRTPDAWPLIYNKKKDPDSDQRWLKEKKGEHWSDPEYSGIRTDKKMSEPLIEPDLNQI